MKYVLLLELLLIPSILSTKTNNYVRFKVEYEVQYETKKTKFGKYSDIASFIKKHEGLVLTPYYCPGNVITIGYGHSIKQNEKLVKINENQADSILMKDIKLAEDFVKSRTNLSGNKLIAITHFVFCIGAGNFIKSSLYQDILNNADIENSLMKWCYIKGKYSNELKKQRDWELKKYNE